VCCISETITVSTTTVSPGSPPQKGRITCISWNRVYIGRDGAVLQLKDRANICMFYIVSLVYSATITVSSTTVSPGSPPQKGRITCISWNRVYIGRDGAVFQLKDRANICMFYIVSLVYSATITVSSTTVSPGSPPQKGRITCISWNTVNIGRDGAVLQPRDPTNHRWAIPAIWPNVQDILQDKAFAR
jgi:hypothetical protein